MRSITIFILLFVVELYAIQSKDSCYSIQIGSFNNASLKDIKKLSFPKDCKIIKKTGAYVIKCECDTETNIRKKLPFYQQNVPSAFLTKTEKKLFKKKIQTNKKFTPKKIIQQIKKEKNTKKTVVKKEKRKGETLNELMYKVFIYNNDLKNAQKVARTSLRRDPTNLIWRKYLADVLSWSGNTKEAFKHYTFIYEKNKLKFNSKPAIKGYGSYDDYFILLEKIFSNPKDQKNIDKFLDTAEKLGNSKEAATDLDKVYNKTKSVTALKKSADLYFRLGFKKAAIKRLKMLEKANLLDIETAMTLSRISFEDKKYSESLKPLLSVQNLANREDKEYWYLLSDVYSYLKQKDKSAKLLRALCIKSKCRKYDYDTLISFYSDKDKDFTMQISLKAFHELKESSYFFSFAKMSLEKKDTNSVIQAIHQLSKKEEREYKKLPLFWLTIASLNNQLGFTEKTIFSYQQALSLDPDSIEILSQYSWFLMSKNRAIELKKVIKKVENRAIEEKKLYILAAAINYKLNNIQKSHQGYLKALQYEPNNIDLKLDYANLLIVMGKKEYANKIIRKVYNQLQKQMSNKPKLLKEEKFLKHYLRSSIYFIPATNYRELIKYAKTILKKEDYININIAWKLYTGDGDYAHYLSKKLKEPELWLQSYLTMRSNNQYAMRDLLYKYATIIPIEDKISMQLKTQQIGLARRDTFKALEEIPESQSLYQTKYNIDTKYGNKFNSEIGYESQGELKKTYAKIENIHHLSSKYYIGGSLNYGKNSSNKINLLNEMKENSTAKLWLKMLMNNGHMEAGAGYTDGYTKYPQYFFNLYNKLTNKVSIKIELEKNKVANETLKLRLEGKKDYSSIGVRYQFNQRLAFETAASYSNYQWQKSDTLGNGQRYHIEAQQKIKFSYPDILFREYLSIADFRNNGIRSLPDDYIEGGIGMQIGMSALNKYSRNWKPYADLSTTYHDSFGLSFAGQLGVSGKFIGNDYLNLSLNYNRSSDDEALWLLKLNHSYLY